MDRILDRLLPRPRHLVQGPDKAVIPGRFRIFLAQAQALELDARRFQTRIANLGLDVELTAVDATRAHVKLAIDAGISRTPGAYRLRVTSRGIDMLGADVAGAWYALCTLEQLLRACRPASSRHPSGATRQREQGVDWVLPELEIVDEPSFPARGLMLDVSRTKVPTLAALRALVDLLAHLKLNQLQLYTEHAFAYAGHETVWRDASPITGDDVLALDAYCRARHVELVPNQQSFGHMHRWLKHEPYRRLAEVPEGIEHAFSRDREPYGLCPTDPSSLAFLEGLYDQLLPHFASRQFNVGLDETIDLGRGRSKEVCARVGTARVYLDYLRAVHARVSARGKCMQFWGDIIVEHPELVRELPRDAIALEWGYEADHPFAAHAHLFAESGLDFYVCPGTSSWQSIAGRTANALANLKSAAEHGERAGARGYLVTDWGDRGHLQPSSASWLGISAAAAFAWNASSSTPTGSSAAPTSGVVSVSRSDLDWPALLDLHVFAEEAHVLGRATCELGDAYLQTGSKSTNGSALFFLLAFASEPLPHARMPNLAIDGLARTLEYTIERRVLLEEARPTSFEGMTAVAEMRWAAELMAFACRFGIARLKLPPGSPVGAMASTERQQLARELEPLIGEHKRAWLVRNRVGGLTESAGWLERVAVLLHARA